MGDYSIDQALLAEVEVSSTVAGIFAGVLEARGIISRAEIADLLEQAGGRSVSALAKTRFTSMAQGLRQGSDQPVLTLVRGGKVED